jgi:hypothetical protein
MATLKTTDVKHVREDLADVISMITPEATPFMSMIGKTSATGKYHEGLSDTLSAPNKDNAAAEGADAAPATQVGPTRFGNWTQIFTATVDVSGTLEASNTAGTKSELSRQMTKKSKELKRDQEAAFVSENLSVASGTRKLAGASALIATNALHGTGGSTAGFNPATSVTGAVVAGTNKALIEADFKAGIGKVWEQSDGAITAFVNGGLKSKISTFTGNSQLTQDASTNEIVNNVKLYECDFGIVKVILSRYVSPTTVLLIDPTLWSVATLRKYQKTELGIKGDSTQYQLLTEVTLECKNEAGNGKLADRT